jgi:hypothetical protein
MRPGGWLSSAALTWDMCCPAFPGCASADPGCSGQGRAGGTGGSRRAADSAQFWGRGA